MWATIVCKLLKLAVHGDVSTKAGEHFIIRQIISPRIEESMENNSVTKHNYIEHWHTLDIILEYQWPGSLKKKMPLCYVIDNEIFQLFTC